MTGELLWLTPCIAVVAALYSSVGHGGASGYLAVLSLRPGVLLPVQMSSTALTLNLLVAGIASTTFAHSGHLSGRITWPFVISSVPAAFIGGAMYVPADLYALLLAVCLGFASLRLLAIDGRPVREPSKPPTLAAALPVGAGIGWLSGVVGVGGGIFLSPLLLLKGWATPHQTAASSAIFILVNSAAGLAGRAVQGTFGYGYLWPLAVAALVGGLLGAGLGAKRFHGHLLRRLLAVVLLVAAAKLLGLAYG